ncbi:hypothetical protein H1D32_02300 [Anaerobacillus sp. CMMVII]|uniref:hypothetical protein n=1 Tax=Anaerobacillus sp. CMMVII TaxID=2755588 RepID=UPI0021B82317|nr:hypothetical protein [Anaerobacillus sp. CMMVII]MCT8136680.1 hypothetical protein [Anaerobacillus sp. CMMVII]
MNWLLLILGVVFLLIVVKIIAELEKVKPATMANEIKKNTIMLPFGIILLLLIIFIPYQVWILFGSPVGWEILYIFGISIFLTLCLCFGYYYRIKTRHQSESHRIIN